MTENPYDHPGLVTAYRLAAMADHREQLDYIKSLPDAYAGDLVELYNVLSAALAVMATSIVGGLVEDRDDTDAVRAYCAAFADRVASGEIS
ncbi:MAG: hypothetical protein Q4G67_12230 [Actinomycetia bacterium]|nr:hypothetical protein [Actinomycetes bacterium]